VLKDIIHCFDVIVQWLASTSSPDLKKSKELERLLAAQVFWRAGFVALFSATIFDCVPYSASA
jgi:hypothetical protein